MCCRRAEGFADGRAPAEAEVVKVWNSLIDPNIVAHAQPAGCKRHAVRERGQQRVAFGNRPLPPQGNSRPLAAQLREESSSRKFPTASGDGSADGSSASFASQINTRSSRPRPDYAINSICAGVRSQASRAHWPNRNPPTSNLHRPPFFISIAASSPPVNEQRNEPAQIRFVADEQDIFRRGFAIRSTAAAKPSRCRREPARRKIEAAFLISIRRPRFPRSVSRAGAGWKESGQSRQFHFTMRGGGCAQAALPFGISGRSASFSKPGVPGSTAMPWRRR